MPGNSVNDISSDPGKKFRNALRAVASHYKRFFGPALGGNFSKLIEDPHGNFVLTSDGQSLIHELAYRNENPISEIILSAGEEQGKLFGDLSKSTVFFTSILIREGLDLIEDGFHPNVVKQGFSRATDACKEWIRERAAKPALDVNTIRDRVFNTLIQKLSPPVAQHLVNLVQKPLHEFLTEKINIASQDGILSSSNNLLADFSEKFIFYLKPGGQIKESFLEKGVLITKEPVAWQEPEPKQLPSQRIALISGELYFEKGGKEGWDVKVSDVEQLKRFEDGTRAFWREQAEKLMSLGAEILITERGTNDELLSELKKLNKQFLTFRRVKKVEMEALARFSRGNIVHSIQVLEKEDLGTIDSIKPIKIKNAHIFLFSKEQRDNYHALLIRGSLHDVCENVQDYLKAGIKAVMAMLEGEVENYPWILNDMANHIKVRGKTDQGDKSIVPMEIHGSTVKKLLDTMIINNGMDPFQHLPAEKKAFNVPAPALEHMLDLSTKIASKLIGIDGFLLNNEGWNKRNKNQGKSQLPAENGGPVQD